MSASKLGRQLLRGLTREIHTAARGTHREFSGDMRQRAMVETAMSIRAKLLIADESTTALDMTV